MPYGINDSTFSNIVSVFSDFDKITRVRLFGSRALGRQRPGSDIDLAIEGKNLSLNDQLELSTKLDDLMLPYRFDIVIVNNEVDAALREHIERVGISIYPAK